MTSVLQVTGIVDAVANELRAAVYKGELAPGQLVTEAWVADRFVVARATGKAAIEKLVADGLLQRTAHRSAQVRVLEAHAIRDVYQTRRRLEGAALRELAGSHMVPPDAKRANDEIALFVGGSSIDIVDPDIRFHTAIVDSIESERTSRAYRSLVAEVKLCMAQVQGRRLISVDLIVDEHARILEFISRGDGESAVRLLAEHLGRAEERLVEALKAGASGSTAAAGSAS